MGRISRLKSTCSVAWSARDGPAATMESTRGNSAKRQIMGSKRRADGRAGKGRWSTDYTAAYFLTYQNQRACVQNSSAGTGVAPSSGMDWITSFPIFPAIYWQRLIMALGLLIIFLSMLMAVEPRSRAARRRAV